MEYIDNNAVIRGRGCTYKPLFGPIRLGLEHVEWFVWRVVYLGFVTKLTLDIRYKSGLSSTGCVPVRILSIYLNLLI